MPRNRVAIACQGGGSHTAFTAGVLQRPPPGPMIATVPSAAPPTCTVSVKVCAAAGAASPRSIVRTNNSENIRRLSTRNSFVSTCTIAVAAPAGRSPTDTGMALMSATPEPAMLILSRMSLSAEAFPCRPEPSLDNYLSGAQRFESAGPRELTLARSLTA